MNCRVGFGKERLEGVKFVYVIVVLILVFDGNNDVLRWSGEMGI